MTIGCGCDPGAELLNNDTSTAKEFSSRLECFDLQRFQYVVHVPMAGGESSSNTGVRLLGDLMGPVRIYISVLKIKRLS